MKYRANIGLKSFIVFLSIMLVAMICIGVTGAVYQGSRRGIGTIVMNKGLYYTVENIYDNEGNLTISGKLQYYPSGDASGAKSDFELLDGVGQNENFLMAPPKIVVQSNSMSFYARAKIEYKYYTLNGSEYVPATGSTLGVSLDTVTTELFSEKLEFNSRWKKSIDGYYYYVNAGTAIPTANSLALINASETIEIFANDKYTTGEWEGDYGGPYGIAKMDISFVLEVVEKDGLDWVFYDIAELGVDFDVETFDTNQARITSITTEKKSIIIPETVVVNGVSCTISNIGSQLLQSPTLENIVFPGTIKNFESGSLSGFAKHITLSEGTESISNGALMLGLIVGLEKITLPSTFKQIIYDVDSVDTTGITISPFAGCQMLKEIEFAGNEYFSFDGRSLIDLNKNELVYYINDTNVFKVPDGIKSLSYIGTSVASLLGAGSMADALSEVYGELGIDFSKYHEYASVFERIEIPDTLTGYEVSDDGRCLIRIDGTDRILLMFAGKGLTEYTIPESANITKVADIYGEDLETIRFSSSVKTYSGGIYSMKKLSKIVLNEGLEEIAKAFDYLPNLTQIKLPSTLTKIDCSCIDLGDTPFGWKTLKILTFTSDTPPTVPQMMGSLSPFTGADSFQVYVPKGKLAAYQEAYKNYSSFDWYKNMKESQ